MITRESALGSVSAVREALEKMASGTPHNIDLPRCITYLKSAEQFLIDEQQAIDKLKELVDLAE